MPSRVDLSGLNKMTAGLKKLRDTKFVPFDELFPPSFMSRHSSLPSFAALVAAAGISQLTKAKLASAEWNAAICTHTKFRTWGEMKKTAGGQWAKRTVEGR